MPLLKRNHNEPAPQPEPARKKGGLFSSGSRDAERDDTRYNNNTSDAPTRKKSMFSRRSGSTSPPTNDSHSNDSGSGFFRRRRSSVSSSDSDRDGSSGMFGRRGGKKSIRKDPTVRAAHQKVADAENAEREADRALEEARQRVKLARDHVHNLEQEAIEDARRAKAKQAEAKMIGKSAKGLGRHG